MSKTFTVSFEVTGFFYETVTADNAAQAILKAEELAKDVRVDCSHTKDVVKVEEV